MRQKRGISAIVSIVLLIAIVVLAAVGIFFYAGGLATKQKTTTRPVVITATAVSPANGTIIVSVLDGTFSGQWLNTTDGTLCDFGSSVTLSAGTQDDCSIPPKAGTTVLYAAQVGSTTVTFSAGEVPTLYMGGTTSSSSAQSDFSGGTFSNTTNGSIVLNSTNSSTFQVNTVTTSNNQDEPSVGMDSSGNFVVAWESEESGGTDYQIKAKAFWANGSVRTSDFVVNTNSTNEQRYPSVAMLSGGDYIIAWRDLRDSGSSLSDAYVKLFYANGTNRTGDVRVNSNTTNSQDFPVVAANSSGDFVVAWYDTRSGSAALFAKTFYANGTNKTNDFRVDDTTSVLSDVPAIAMDPNGNFAIAWPVSTGGTFDVYAKAFWSNASNLSADFRLHSVTTGTQGSPSVSMDSSGNYVFVWNDERAGVGVGGVYAKAFYANGTNRTNDFRLNETGLPFTSSPAVVMASNGDYLVAWADRRTGSLDSIYAKTYFANDTVNQNDFLLSLSSGNTQYMTQAAANGTGNFVVAWARVVSTGDVFASAVGTFYSVNGTFTSSIIDTGYSPASFTQFSATDSVQTGSTINYSLFFSNASDFATNTTEYVTNPDTSISTTGRYVRYRANITTRDTIATPSISSVTISYRPNTFSLTYAVNYESGIGNVNLFQNCTGNFTLVDGPRNAGGAAFYSRIVAGLNASSSCPSYILQALTPSSGAIGNKTFNI
jgi:hypothetical protein